MVVFHKSRPKHSLEILFPARQYTDSGIGDLQNLRASLRSAGDVLDRIIANSDCR